MSKFARWIIRSILKPFQVNGTVHTSSKCLQKIFVLLCRTFHRRKGWASGQSKKGCRLFDDITSTRYRCSPSSTAGNRNLIHVVKNRFLTAVSSPSSTCAAACSADLSTHLTHTTRPLKTQKSQIIIEYNNFCKTVSQKKFSPLEEETFAFSRH